jgi:large subunit ribosomal protein L29
MSSLDTADLATKSQDAQEQLFRLRFQMGMGQYEGLKKYRALRKDRARMLTELAGRKKNQPNVAAVAAIQSAAGKKVNTKAAPKVAAPKAASVKKAAVAGKKPVAAAVAAKKPEAKKEKKAK